MTRLRCFPMIAAAAALVAAFAGRWSAAAEAEAKPGAPRAAGQAMVVAGQPWSYAVPGFSSLASQDTQKELELVDAQREKLKEIAQDYYKQMQEDWAELRDLAPEKRQEAYAKIRDKQLERMAEVRRQVKKVLLPHQLETLEMIELQRTGVGYLQMPRLQEQLGLTEKQKEQLRENREELMRKMQDLQKESAEQALDILKPAQIEKLKQMSAEGFRSLYQPPQNPQ